MKTVKPFRLSIMTRPYRWQRADHLGVAVIALASLEDDPKLLSEQALWQMAAEEIGGVVDLGIPKLQAEFLASGYAYTNHQTDKTACAVRLRVGATEKALLAFGDRYWLDGKLTRPASFSAMPLDWAHAYGGPGVPENPLGIGSADEVINGVSTRRVPNIEMPTQRVTAPGQRMQPASFGGLAPESPQRFAYMGKQYNEGWLETDYPGFAADMDWRFFNAAPADQWPSGAQALAEQAEYEIWNMHPSKPMQQGRLPAWRARCFASRHLDGSALEEISLRLTTAWFVPHRDQVILIWHGTLPIREDDAADIKHIMPALELPKQERPVEHYQTVLALRLDRERGAVHALRDGDLVPSHICGPGPEPMSADVMNRPSVQRMKQGMARAQAEGHAALAGIGQDAKKILPLHEMGERPIDVNELPAALDRIAAEQDRAKQALRDARAQLVADGILRSDEALAKLDTDSLVSPRNIAGEALRPASGRIEVDALLAQMSEFDAGGTALQARPMRERMEPLVRTLHLQSAHLYERPHAMTPQRAARTRQRITDAIAGRRPLTATSLIGADLSGMDLRGADLRGMSLEGADLTGSCLDGCDLSSAVLAHALLKGTSLRNTLLHGASFGRALCEQACFDGSNFTDTNLEHAQFSGCSFRTSTFTRARMLTTRLHNCDFEGSRIEEMTALQMNMHNVRFRQATLSRCGFVDSVLEEISFAGASLDRVAFLKSDCSGMDLADATLLTCSFSGGASLAKASLVRAKLKECGLRGTAMQGADLSYATLAGCDLSECDLRDAVLDSITAPDSLLIRADLQGASLRDANLMQSVLAKANLLRADMTGANLFRADISQAIIDASTLLHGAYTRDAKLWPKRSSEAAA